MLYSVGSDMIRLQCAFVDTPEVERIINHIGKQKAMVLLISYQNTRVMMLKEVVIPSMQMIWMKCSMKQPVWWCKVNMEVPV